jgi:single-strand DNA-binding protein
MYALKNKAQLIGHVASTPEITDLAGKKVARFSVATYDSYRNSKGEKVSETQWHNLTCYGKIADIAEKYIIKGSEVAIEGKLVHRTYADTEGNKRSIYEIQVHELLLLGGLKK